MQGAFHAARTRLVAAFALAACLLAVQPAVAAPAVYQKTLHSTGWMVVPVDKDRCEMGTCWVLDREKRLVLTNHHVVLDRIDVIVYFPSWAGTEVITNSGYYLQNVQPISGRVRTIDAKRDLALIELASLPDDIRALPLATKSPEPGTPVHSIGNSGMANVPMNRGILWRLREGKVTEKAGFRVLNSTNTGNRVEASIILTNSASRPGDSGGPMVDDQGRLVGVVRGNNAEDPQTAHVIDVSEVREFLARWKNPPRPLSNIVGTWTLSFGETGKESFLGVSFKTDGSCLVETGSKSMPGKYTYAANTLTLEVIDMNLRDTLQLTWAGKNKFNFLSGQKKFTWDRR